MKIVLVSKCSLDIEQHVEFKMSVLISPSKSLISLRWVTYGFKLLICGPSGEFKLESHTENTDYKRI